MANTAGGWYDNGVLNEPARDFRGRIIQPEYRQPLGFFMTALTSVVGGVGAALVVNKLAKSSKRGK
jgi:hypothetical protein